MVICLSFITWFKMYMVCYWNIGFFKYTALLNSHVGVFGIWTFFHIKNTVGGKVLGSFAWLQIYN